MSEPAGVAELGAQLRSLGWVTDLLVAGSAATGDYQPGVSDLDLVAVTAGPVHRVRRNELKSIHAALEQGVANGLNLGCVYVNEQTLADQDAQHPTWTHGSMTGRTLSGITRAELNRYGYAVFGRSPKVVVPQVHDDDVRLAAQAELTGYWASAAARPWEWLDPVIVDLGLTTMARGRHAMATGQLVTKTSAIEMVDAPTWLVDQLRARRRGERVTSPRLRSAWYAWQDARRTIAVAQSWSKIDRKS